MADNLCGPSNALQNFQKHSGADRTLQQDRFATRPGPSEGFRSHINPAVGALDAEFEAFQRDQSPLLHHDVGGLPSYRYIHGDPSDLTTQNGETSWIGDFQRLGVSKGSLPPQHHSQFQQSPQPIHNTSWNTEFANRGLLSLQDRSAFGQSSTGSYAAAVASNRMQAYAGPMMMRQQQQPQLPTTVAETPIEQFDDAAFERAFEAAAKAELQAPQSTAEQTIGREDLSEMQNTDDRVDEILLDTSAERFMGEQSQPLSQEKIGSDLIHDPTQDPDGDNKLLDHDELSKVAGGLLDRVNKNRSEKFLNSQFLELMRRFRDKEVRVQGDDIVGADEEAGLHS